MFGIDNALIGDWPVVTIKSGKARIAEFVSISDWLDNHEKLFRHHMKQMGQLWQQRIENPEQIASAVFG